MAFRRASAASDEKCESVKSYKKTKRRTCQQVEECRFVPEPPDLLQEVLEERERKRTKTA